MPAGRTGAVPAAVRPGGGDRPADRRRRGPPRGRRRDRRRRPGRPRLRQPGDAAARGRAGADREARRDPGGGDREGQGLRRPQRVRGEHGPVGDGEAVPRPRPVRLAGLPEGREGRRLSADQEAGDPAEAAAAELPQPRQLRHLGLEAEPLPRREGRGGGRLHPHRDRGRQAAGRGPDRQGHPLRRQGPRPRRRGARQLRARLRPDGQGHRSGRGHGQPPDPVRRRLLRPRRRPDALGDRRQGGLEGPEAARPGHPHDELAAAGPPQVQRVRRQLHLPDGRGQALHRHGRRPRHHRRDLLLPRRAAAAEDPPVRPQAARRRRARRLGREDDPLRRLLDDAEAALGARHGHVPATTSRWSTSRT